MCTEQMCDNCYGAALGHELIKTSAGQDSVCGGLFSGGPLQDNTGEYFDCPVRMRHNHLVYLGLILQS